MPDPKRFNTLAQPIAAPGCCLLCRSAEGPMIDTGVNIPWHGAVYICVTRCLKEMARELPRENNDAERALVRGFKQGEAKANRDADARMARVLNNAIRDLGIGPAVMAEFEALPSNAGQ